MGWPTLYEDCIRRNVPYLDQAKELLPEQDFREVGLDSLSTVRLLIDLEATFSVQFPDEHVTADTFKTAESLWRVVSSLVAEQNVS